jgi:hypothetical protein
MITFNITNIVAENNKIIVFYKFSNGVEYSNRFETNATLIDLMNWGNTQLETFNNQDIQEVVINLMEEVNDSNS